MQYDDAAPGRGRALVSIAFAQLLALSLWFSASAVSDSLARVWAIESSDLPLLTISVQLGFVVGAFGLAASNLADRIPTRRLFAISAVAGAVLNGGLLLLGPGSLPIAVVIRFLVGASLAGVYPSGMKAIAGWFRRGRGMALGVLVGALTVGSALPHLVRGLGFDWRGVLTAASIGAVAAAVMMTLVGDGPFETPVSRFSWSHLADTVRHRGFRLATAGYLGHMWELYAMWTWIAAWVTASGLANPSVLAFVVIAAGGLGSGLAGILADRRGRTIAAGGSLVLSGSMAGLTVVVFGAPASVVVPVLVVWGLTVVSDSAQFSAMVTEVVPDEVRGTALALQTASGFLLTLASIWIVPRIAEAAGWRWAFLVLVAGPVAGVEAMRRLRSSEWRRALAGGLG